MKDLESYLRQDARRGVTDYVLRSSVAADGRVTFYVHPAHTSGDTLDFEVSGNALQQNRDVIYLG